MPKNPLALPIGPEASRVFFGYRALELREQPGDSPDERGRKRRTFFNDLGATFMPGTPLMQAPLGLAAYIPAVIDPPADSGLPDEVALIVYVSRAVYDATRETSLLRRMYTKSHAAVFDMRRSRAQFPGPSDEPATLASTGEELRYWYEFRDRVDWQDGATRILFVTPGGGESTFQQQLLEATRKAAPSLRARGVDQLIVGAGRNFAALWVHAAAPLADPDAVLDLVPQGCTVLRDLPASPAWVRGDADQGVRIDGPAAFSFLFSRDLKYFTGASE
jgi:hypothetical protein